MEMSKTVEGYFDKHPDWRPILAKLRQLFLDTELEETVKWGIPVYTLNKKNVAGIGAFKSYAGIWFFQGVFLSDPDNLLINAQDGKTKGMRQMRFQSLEEVDPAVITSFILEAIQNQKEGKEIAIAKGKALVIPQELKDAFQAMPELDASFQAFTLGKQREFAEYISEAKRAETRSKRLEKIIPMIKEGTGLNDKYR